MADFGEGYNQHHHHTGIGLSTPADVHYGLATAKAAERAVVRPLREAGIPSGSPPAKPLRSCRSRPPRGSTSPPTTAASS